MPNAPQMTGKPYIAALSASYRGAACACTAACMHACRLTRLSQQQQGGCTRAGHCGAWLGRQQRRLSLHRAACERQALPGRHRQSGSCNFYRALQACTVASIDCCAVEHPVPQAQSRALPLPSHMSCTMDSVASKAVSISLQIVIEAPCWGSSSTNILQALDAEADVPP